VDDLRLDGAGAVGQLWERRRGARHGDNGGAGLGEGRGDPAAQTAARPDDDRGPAGQVAHCVLQTAFRVKIYLISGSYSGLGDLEIRQWYALSSQRAPAPSRRDSRQGCWEPEPGAGRPASWRLRLEPGAVPPVVAWPGRARVFVPVLEAPPVPRML